MSEREGCARRFAEALTWTYDDNGGRCWPSFGRPTGEQCARRDVETIPLPPAHAPLHEHLAFVGHVAEALESRRCCTIWMRGLNADVYFDDPPSVVDVGPPTEGDRDLSWAAMLSAIEARNGGSA